LRGILPDEVIDRRKQGFTPPESTWMRVNSRRWIESVLLSDQSLERGLFKPDAVRRIVSEHMDGTDNHRFLLWSLLSLEFTQRSFLDGAQPVRPASRIGDVPAETAA
jgi:asparagine synthase (glutamine-hydrolysing)